MISTLYNTRTGDDPAAAQLLALLQKQGYHGLSSVNLERVILLTALKLSSRAKKNMGKSGFST